MRSIFYCPIGLLILISLQVSAQMAGQPSVITVGPEFTFTNEDELKLEKYSMSEFADSIWQVIKEKCKRLRPKCEVDRSEGLVTFKDGFWIKVDRDPGVLEVTMKPMSVAEIRRRKAMLQSLVFDSMEAVGLLPHPIEGGGHINVDKGVFKGKPKLLRDFVVDYYNHKELAQGIFEYDSEFFTQDVRNAPAYHEWIKKGQKAFVDLVTRFDEGKIISEDDFAAQYAGEVQRFASSRRGEDYFSMRYNAINMNHFWEGDPQERRMELRGFRPQRSMEEFLVEAEILEARLNFLQRQKAVIPFRPPGKLSMQARVDRYYTYITEMGLDWDRYSSIVPGIFKRQLRKPKVCVDAALRSI